MITTVTSSEKQEQVQVYWYRTHIYLNEREVEMQGMDEEVYTQYEYRVVTLPAYFAGDALELGKEMFALKVVEEAKQYLLDTDHKLVSDYQLNDGETNEDIDAIKQKRSEARAIARGL
jgi:hypothetical protein